MTWSRVAARYAEAFRRTRLATAVKPRRPTLAAPARLPDRPLPSLVLDHLWRLTDSTGVFQHATHDLPNRAEGYCTDDNARAVTLMVTFDELGMATPRTAAATATYAAFMGHAFVSATGRFRNFLGFDRRWLDDGGSDDCLGRAIVALGTCIGRSSKSSLRRWAMPMFEPAVRAVLTTTSPRAWSLAILGIQEYLRRLRGDRTIVAIRAELTARLLDLAERCRTPAWPWFEEIVAYENARPCQALISAGRWAGYTAALDAGLEMLDWLAGVQASPTGRFSPVGCKGFLQRGSDGTRSGALFDQQPLEAQATIAASIEAFHATGDHRWRDRAWNAFDWFRGHNVLGLSLCDPHTGGCRDGLLEDRVNENQGAESTLAWLAALAEMKALEAESSLAPPVAITSVRGGVPCR